MALLADITHGHVLLADWMFLIAAVLALLAAIAYAPKTVTPNLTVWASALVALAVTLLAVGWLVL